MYLNWKILHSSLNDFKLNSNKSSISTQHKMTRTVFSRSFVLWPLGNCSLLPRRSVMLISYITMQTWICWSKRLSLYAMNLIEKFLVGINQVSHMKNGSIVSPLEAAGYSAVIWSGKDCSNLPRSILDISTQTKDFKKSNSSSKRYQRPKNRG